MSKAEIRGWKQGDLEQIVDLWLELANHIRPMDGFYEISRDAKDKYNRYLHRVFNNRNYVAFVADTDEGLVGFAMGRINESPSVVVPENVAYIENIFTKEGRRQSGIGTALCNRLLDWFKKRGVNHVELFYQIQNSEAAAFWKKMGFTTWLAKAYKIL